MKRLLKEIRLILVLALAFSAQIACSLLQPLPDEVVEAPPEITWEIPPSITAILPTIQTPSAEPQASTSSEEPIEPYGGEARSYLEEIVSEIGPRLTGSEADRAMANYVQVELEKMGYEVERQPFNIDDGQDWSFESTNIIAVKEGESEREIVVGAHYDSADDGEGADDNASGVAVLLETARRIKDATTPHTVRFIAFGAEETGLNGSSYYVTHLSHTDRKNTIYMVNMDSLIAGEIAYIYGDVTRADNLRDWMLKQARKGGYSVEGKTAEDLDPPDDPCECSDYYPFKAAGIPYVFFEATNWNLGEMDGWTQVNPDFGDNGMIWHTPYDTIEYIEKIAPERIDEHLETYVTLLVKALTEYNMPE